MAATLTASSAPTFGVIGADGVYLSTGARLALPEFQQLRYWLDAATRRNIGALWLHPSASWRWLDADIDACDPWIIAGSAGPDEGEPWWTATRQGVYGVRDIIQPRYEDRAPWRETPSAGALRDALNAFRTAVGFDWRRSPGATGLRLLRQLHSGRGAARLELDGAPPPPALDGLVSDAGHLSYTRAPRVGEGAYLHSYDVNGQYLAACSSLALGVGAWQHHTHVTLDAKPANWEPGYYFVRAAEKAKEGPCPAILTNHTGTWVTTPTLRLLREQGAMLHVRESYTWAASKRYLEPWYKTLRDARAQLTDPYALDAVKGIYRYSFAWFESRKWDRSEDTLYRPDWAHQVRALARANVLRTVYRVAQLYGVSPLAVGSDCVYYLSDSPDPLAPPWVARITNGCVGEGLRISKQLGHFKVKDAGVPFGEIAAYTQGRQWDLIALQAYLNLRAGRKAA